MAQKVSIRAATRCACCLTYSFISTLHWSLRLRAVCSFFAHVPYAAYQVQLHKGMHILVFFGVNKLPGLEIGQDGFQAPGERLSLGGGEQAAFYLHGHMGKAALAYPAPPASWCASTRC